MCRCGVSPYAATSRECATSSGDHSRGPLSGRTILVTGATGAGVGSGVCDAVFAAGGRLALNGLSNGLLEPVLERYPGSVGLAGDISRPVDAEYVVRTATERCGPITGLVNNAGVGLSEPFYEASTEEFDHVFGVDVRGLWLVTRAFTRALLPVGLPGAIVNVSSVHSRATMQNYAVYAAAKAAVDGFTRGVAVELGRFGVRCNAIAPGYVQSEQNYSLLKRFTPDPAAWVERHRRVEQPLRRLIEPIDCGWLCAFLLSEQSRSITGQTVAVDAGLSARLYNWDPATFHIQEPGALRHADSPPTPDATGQIL